MFINSLQIQRQQIHKAGSDNDRSTGRQVHLKGKENSQKCEDQTENDRCDHHFCRCFHIKKGNSSRQGQKSDHEDEPYDADENNNGQSDQDQKKNIEEIDR